MLIGMHSARPSAKVLKVETGRNCTITTQKGEGRPVLRSQMQNHKAGALWKMKVVKGRGEQFYGPERKDNILGRNKTRLELWEEHLKGPIVALDKALKCVESSSWGVSRPETCGGSVLQWPVLAFSKVCGKKKPIWEGVWPFLDPWDSVCLRTTSVEWNVPGKYGPHGELFSA